MRWGMDKVVSGRTPRSLGKERKEAGRQQKQRETDQDIARRMRMRSKIRASVASRRCRIWLRTLNMRPIPLPLRARSHWPAHSASLLRGRWAIRQFYRARCPPGPAHRPLSRVLAGHAARLVTKQLHKYIAPATAPAQTPPLAATRRPRHSGSRRASSNSDALVC